MASAPSSSAPSSSAPSSSAPSSSAPSSSAPSSSAPAPPTYAPPTPTAATSTSTGNSSSATTTTTYAPLNPGDGGGSGGGAPRARQASMSGKRSSRVFETNELTAPLDEGLQDGPVFRATIEELERGALGLRTKLKQIIKAAGTFIEQDQVVDPAALELVDSLRALETMAPAVQYLERVFGKLQEAKRAFHHQLQSLLLEPLEKIYANDLQALEEKKKGFDQNSNEYNAHLEKYLATMRDAKETKLRKTDEKFLQRRGAYNIQRFDYLTNLEELHFKKEQEVLYHVSSFAEKHAAYYNKCAKLIEANKPELDELNASVSSSFSEIKNWIKERQDTRKMIEHASHVAAEKMITLTAQSHRNSVSKFRGIRDLVLVDNVADISDNKQGFLFTKHSNWREWRKVWVVVDDGMFHEYAHWKPDSKIKNGVSIDLRTTMVKEALKSERRFCFELISPQSKRLYQALSRDDMSSWISVVQKAVQLSLNRRMSFQTLPVGSPQPADENRVRRELTKDPSNELCADCGTKNPEWGSINLGVLVCIGCSGIHRSLGTHISKMRSITLDTVSWTPEVLGVFRGLGNATTNSILEYRSVEIEKPLPTATREDKAKYITAKYAAHALAEPADETVVPLKVLVRATARDDLAGALRALVWGADVNGLADEDTDDLLATYDEPQDDSDTDESPASPGPPSLLSTSASSVPGRLALTVSDADKWFTHDTPVTPMVARPAQSGGLAALHVAVRDGFAAMAEFLLLNGADLNLPDRRGNTPLHHAALRGDDAAVTFLIKREARLDVRNAAGQRPADIALEQGSQKLIALLLPPAGSTFSI